MKRYLSSAFSLLTSLALLSGGSTLQALAESVTEEHGVIEESGELCIGESGTFDSGILSFTDTADILANYSDGAFNHGYYLDENNAEVYMAFMKLINPSLDTITVTLPEPVTFTASSVNLTTSADQQAFQDAVFGNCRPAMDCALFDIPELFWIDEALVGVKATNMTYSRNRKTGVYTFTIPALSFAPAFYDGFESLDEVLEYKDKLDTAAAEFVVEGDTRYEQIKSIHDQISLFTYYDTGARFSGSALGALVEPGVVCEGYSKAFKMICDRVGIPCICVFGNYDEEKLAAHMWNYVLMEDGEWYGVDVTWDDYDGKDGKEIIYSYFMKGSTNFFKTHTEAAEYSYTHLTYPTLSTYDYDPSKTAAVTTAEASVTTVTTSASTTTTAAPTTTVTTAPKTTTTTETATTVRTTTTATVLTTTSYAETVTKTQTTAADTTTKRSETTTTTVTAVTTTSVTSAASTTAKTTTETAAVTATETTPSAPEPVKGDINQDGAANVADLVYCSRVLLGAVKQEHSCDINGDGTADTFDLVILRRIVLSQLITID